MLALIQRVTFANVVVEGEPIAAIDQGLLVLLGVEKNDTTTHVTRMTERLLGYRVFPDEDDKMNKNIREIQGEMLIVPQFTLAADTKKGMRPSFTPAGDSEQGQQLFDALVTHLQTQYKSIKTGVFGAHMQVSLCNDGPVTFLLKG